MSGEDLTHRAIACAGWMPGMRTLDGDRLSDRDVLVDVCIGIYDGALPDLDDGATLGCLEERLFAAWPGARISIEVDPWADPERHQVPCAEVRICPAPDVACRSFFGRGPRARAEAIIAALEAAPRREPSA